MKRFLCYCVLLLTIIACDYSVDKSIVLKVDVTTASSNIYSFFDFFERVDLIPIDNVYLISNGQFSEPQYFSVWENGFIILDEKNGGLYSFDKNGRFQKRLSERGRANNEYTLAYGIQTNNQTGTTTVLDPRCNLYRYQVDGEFIGKERIEGIIAVHNFIEKNGTSILFTASEKENLHLWNEGELITIDYNPAISPKGRFNAPYPFIEHNGVIYYYEGLTGSIYELNLSSALAEKRYSWDFGKHNIKISRLKESDNDFLTSLSGDFYNCVYPFLNLLWIRDVFIAGVLFHNTEHVLFYNTKNGASYLISQFKEGIKFTIVR